MTRSIFIVLFFISTSIFGRTIDSIPTIDTIDLNSLKNQTIHKFWLKAGTDAFGNAIQIPVLIAKGSQQKPVLGLTAAIHGNELNGIPIIQQVFEKIDVKKLNGVVIAVPGINPVSIFNDRRSFIDEVDLNRIFPGKEKGDISQQMVFQINEKLIKLFNYHVDMHTASFGRVNSFYARADMNNDTLAAMAKLQRPDIILSNKGAPSFGSGDSQTLRETALQQGTYSITVEYGNPQVYQPEMIQRGVQGITSLLGWLKMTDHDVTMPNINLICSRSFWIYTKKGGFLELKVELNQSVKKGQLIAILRNPFGDIIDNYLAPEDGVVIGKSTNPVNMSGGRIVHLGILQK